MAKVYTQFKFTNEIKASARGLTVNEYLNGNEVIEDTPQYKELCDQAPYEVLVQNTQDCMSDELYKHTLGELLRDGEHALSLYYTVGHINNELKEDDLQTWKSDIKEIKSWIKKVKNQLSYEVNKKNGGNKMKKLESVYKNTMELLNKKIMDDESVYLNYFNDENDFFDMFGIDIEVNLSTDKLNTILNNYYSFPQKMELGEPFIILDDSATVGGIVFSRDNDVNHIIQCMESRLPYSACVISAI